MIEEQRQLDEQLKVLEPKNIKRLMVNLKEFFPKKKLNDLTSRQSEFLFRQANVLSQGRSKIEN
jgi:hypothetical protein